MTIVIASTPTCTTPKWILCELQRRLSITGDSKLYNGKLETIPQPRDNPRKDPKGSPTTNLSGTGRHSDTEKPTDRNSAEIARIARLVWLVSEQRTTSLSQPAKMSAFPSNCVGLVVPTLSLRGVPELQPFELLATVRWPSWSHSMWPVAVPPSAELAVLVAARISSGPTQTDPPS